MKYALTAAIVAGLIVVSVGLVKHYHIDFNTASAKVTETLKVTSQPSVTDPVKTWDSVNPKTK